MQTAEREHLLGPWAEFVEERGGFFPSVGIHSMAGDHRGHYGHGHYFHGNMLVCSCGAGLGIFTVALSDDMPPFLAECPICRDFPQFAATLDDVL